MLKLGAISALSAGVAAHGASIVESWQEEARSKSPYAKITHDLSQLKWKLIGLSPFFDNYAQNQTMPALPCLMRDR